jgi:BMFP domain-containing protein YqiC
MQTSNRLLDDLARVASGAASALSGVKQEIDALVRQRLDRLVAELDLVSRDEFEAMATVATNARAGQEELVVRVAELEARIAQLEQGMATQGSPSEDASESHP